jgi:hypothetical protein
VQVGQANFLAPRWAPTTLAALAEDVAIEMAKQPVRVRALGRRQAIVTAMDRHVRRELSSTLRLRYRRLARHCWQRWAIGYADAYLAARSDPAPARWVMRRRRQVALSAFLDAQMSRWAEIAGGLEPPVSRHAAWH